jgi:hypothetical protein
MKLQSLDTETDAFEHARGKLRWNKPFRELFDIATQNVKAIWSLQDGEIPDTDDAYGDRYKSKVPKEFDWKKKDQTLRCRQENLAVYEEETGTLRVRRDLWYLLSPRQKTSLRLHEIIYALERRLLGSVDSWGTRTFIQYLFAKKDLTLGALYRDASDIQQWIVWEMERFMESYSKLLNGFSPRRFDRALYRPQDGDQCILSIYQAGEKSFLKRMQNPVLSATRNSELGCAGKQPIELRCEETANRCEALDRSFTLHFSGSYQFSLRKNGEEPRAYVWAY